MQRLIFPDLILKRIAQVDREIDRRVYALYDLTEEEIKVVKGG